MIHALTCRWTLITNQKQVGQLLQTNRAATWAVFGSWRGCCQLAGINDGQSTREMKWKWITELVDARQAFEHYWKSMKTNKQIMLAKNTVLPLHCIYYKLNVLKPNTASSDKTVSDCVLSQVQPQTIQKLHRVRKKRCHFNFACNSAKC